MPRMAFGWAVTINAPVEQVFSYLRDPSNLFHGLAGGNPDVRHPVGHPPRPGPAVVQS